jgi:hypothetical protein
MNNKVDGYVFRPRKWYEPTAEDFIKAITIFGAFLIGWFFVFPALRFILTVL